MQGSVAVRQQTQRRHQRSGKKRPERPKDTDPFHLRCSLVITFRTSSALIVPMPKVVGTVQNTLTTSPVVPSEMRWGMAIPKRKDILHIADNGNLILIDSGKVLINADHRELGINACPKIGQHMNRWIRHQSTVGSFLEILAKPKSRHPGPPADS